MISIKNPCTEPWNGMTPANGGRYCDRCCKVVVDFTSCTNDEIIGYFEARRGERICGRFVPAQVTSVKPKRRMVRFIAAALAVFGFALFSSCGDKEQRPIMGDTMCVDSAKVARDHQNRTDSINAANAIKPEPAFHLSAADSTRVADSVAKKKNPVRDFN